MNATFTTNIATNAAVSGIGAGESINKIEIVWIKLGTDDVGREDLTNQTNLANSSAAAISAGRTVTLTTGTNDSAISAFQTAAGTVIDVGTLSSGIAYVPAVRVTENMVGGGTQSGSWTKGDTVNALSLSKIYIAGGASYSGTVINTTDKYSFASGTFTNITSIGTPRQAPGAASNATVGIIAGGRTSVNVALSDKITFSSDVVASATALITARQTLAAAGNATVGIFNGGQNSSNGTIAICEKYNYSGDTVSSGTSVGTARQSHGSIGNTTIGIFAGGYNGITHIATSDKYTYSGDTVGTGSSLATSRYGLAGGSNSVAGILAGGYNTVFLAVVDKYTFSGNVVQTSASLSASLRENAGGGVDTTSNLVGIFGGDASGVGALSTTEWISLSSGVVTGGTVLLSTRRSTAVASTNHGGL